MVASELHQVVGHPINGQADAGLLSQKHVQGIQKDKAMAETLLVTAFYSCAFGRVVDQAVDDSAKGLLRSGSIGVLSRHDFNRCGKIPCSQH